MSDLLYHLVPTDPNFVPEEALARSAREYIIKNISEDYSLYVEYSIDDDIEFVGFGQNFETVQCNVCKEYLDIDWWRDEMTKSHQNKFMDLKIFTPCCSKSTSLNDLVYEIGGAAFGKFSITTWSPPTWPTDIVSQVETILGTPLTLVVKHL